MHCELCPLGRGDSLVLNRNDIGRGLSLHLCMMVQHEFACYTISRDGMDVCYVGFLAREYVMGEKSGQLDGAMVHHAGVQAGPTTTTVVTHVTLFLFFTDFNCN